MLKVGGFLALVAVLVLAARLFSIPWQKQIEEVNDDPGDI